MKTNVPILGPIYVLLCLSAGCISIGGKSRNLDGKSSEMVVDLGDGVKMPFVWIGAVQGWVGKYEVTNEEYRRFKPDHDSKDYEGKTLNGSRQPAVYVSYDEAEAFCGWMNRTERLPQGYKARLPFGDEWTVFGKCGDGREYPWGDGWSPKYGNYADATAGWSFPKWTVVEEYNDGYDVSCPVEQSGRNDWGLYGVGGNVWEWTSEARSSFRMIRGGSWRFGQRYSEHFGGRGGLRVSARRDCVPSGHDCDIGFRVVLFR